LQVQQLNHFLTRQTMQYIDCLVELEWLRRHVDLVLRDPRVIDDVVDHVEQEKGALADDL
jgi:hypothetical protein